MDDKHGISAWAAYTDYRQSPIGGFYMRGKQATIQLLKSLLDYESNTKLGKALQYAVSQVEKNIDNDITEEEIGELVESFVEAENVYYGSTIYCIMDGKTERLSKELFGLVSGSNVGA